MRRLKTGEELLHKLYRNLYLEYKKNDNLPAHGRIAKMLERLEAVTTKTIEKDKYDLIKKLYYNKYVIKEIPDSYYKLQEKIALERGHGRTHYTEKMKDREKEVIIDEQKASLDAWLDYFNSDDAMYPTWAKYWAFQGMLKMGSYDKEKREFTKRSKNTTSPFIDLNREVLALSVDYMMKFLDEETLSDDEKLNKLIEVGSFKKIYEHIYNNITYKKQENNTIEGKWVKYNQGSDHMPLVESLKGKGTGWCTAGEEIAKNQLSYGNFYVYYSKDENNLFTNPRIAIRMEDNFIAEIRGVNKNQNLEPELDSILTEKLEEFPDKDKYIKKTNDMKMLTHIYNKDCKGESLTKDELIFLYEIENQIDGFGYEDEQDPRVNEIRKRRNLKKDLACIYDLNEEEITNDKRDLFSGKSIKYFCGSIGIEDYEKKNFQMPDNILGNLYLHRLKSARGLKLPTMITGSLSLADLRRAEGLELPITVGDLDLRRLTSAKGLELPTTVQKLDLNSLTSAEGLELPTTVRSLDLSSLTSVKGLKLPTTVEESLDLRSLTSAEGLELPTTVGSLYLSNLTSAKGLKFPAALESLYLGSLTSAEGLELPTTVRSLYLSSLTSAKGLELPTTVEDLNLRRLTSAKGLEIPTTVRRLDLRSLTSAEGLELPTTVEESLDLRSLTSAEGLELPTTVRSLYLGSLTSVKGLKLPTTVRWLFLEGLKSAEGLELPTAVEVLDLNGLKSAEGLKFPAVIESLYLNGLTSAKGLELPTKITEELDLRGLISAKGIKVPNNFFCSTRINIGDKRLNQTEFLEEVRNANLDNATTRSM